MCMSSMSVKHKHHLSTGFSQALKASVAGGRHCCCFTDEKSNEAGDEVGPEVPQ